MKAEGDEAEPPTETCAPHDDRDALWRDPCTSLVFTVVSQGEWQGQRQRHIWIRDQHRSAGRDKRHLMHRQCRLADRGRSAPSGFSRNRARSQSGSWPRWVYRCSPSQGQGQGQGSGSGPASGYDVAAMVRARVAKLYHFAAGSGLGTGL